MILCQYNVDTSNICMKEFIIFWGQILLKSSFQNPSFFTDSYCAGVSNKHCLLTFFIFYNFGKKNSDG